MVQGAPNTSYGPQVWAILKTLNPLEKKAFFKALRRQQQEIQTRLTEMTFNRDRALALTQYLGKEGSHLAAKAQTLAEEQEQAIRFMKAIEHQIVLMRKDHDPQRHDSDPLHADFYAGFQFSSLYRDSEQSSSSFFARSKPFVSLDIRQTFRWPANEQWIQAFGTVSFQSSSKEKSDTVDVITTSGAFRGEAGVWWMTTLTEEVSWGVVGSLGLVGYAVPPEGPDLVYSRKDEFRNRSRLGLTVRQEEGPLKGSVAEVAYVRDPQFFHRDRLVLRGRVLITQLGSQGSSGDFYMEGFVSKGRAGRDEAVLLLGIRLSTLSFFRSLGWTGFS